MAKFYLLNYEPPITRIQKIREATFTFTSLSFAVLLLMILFRVLEFSLLAFSGKMLTGGGGYFFQSVWYDAKLWLLFSGFLLMPYLLAGLINKTFANWLYYILAGIFLLTYINLILYYQLTLNPLGADFFAYSMQDIKITVKASGALNLKNILFILVIMCLVFLILRKLQKISYTKFPVLAFFVVCIFSLLFIKVKGLIPAEGSFKDTKAFYLVANKMGYFIAKSYTHFAGNNDVVTGGNLDQLFISEADSIMAVPFVDPSFPFLKRADSNDVLGPFFNKVTEKPDIVFVVVEGLGRSFSGPNAVHGSFTPFLDSLGQKGLYWENFTSSAGRTFAILPSLFGSLPYFNTGFIESKMPDHLSLLSILKKQGYRTSFYYGGEATFDKMQAFLQKEKTDDITDSKNFEKTYTKLPPRSDNFSWGFGDFELYDKSIKMIKTAVQPSVHVLLTVSTHDPFLIPNQGFYIKQAQDKINAISKSKEDKDEHLTYINQYSTVLYADNALRKLLSDYAALPKYKNTIFIITGDHQMPDIPIGTQMERFHVPLIIYSPLLSRMASFKGVCSQLDVAPSILNFMKKNYGINLPSLNHWLGTGLDTSASFRSLKSFPLKRNKNELLDYVSGEYFYSDGQLYKLSSNMFITKKENELLSKTIAAKFQVYKNKNAAASGMPSLIPDSLQIYR